MITKRVKIALAAFVVGAVLAVAAGAGAYFWYRAFQLQEALKYGQAAYDRKDWTAARQRFGVYLRKRPENTEVLQKYADACYQIIEDRPSMLREMIMAYNQIARNNPTDASAVKRLVTVCLRVSSWNNLDYYTNRFMARFPNEQWLRYYHALALDRLNRSQEAIQAYQALIKEGTEFYDAYHSVADRMAQTGFKAQAEELLNKAVEEHPGAAPYLLQRALFRLQNGSVELAAADVEQAMGSERDPAKFDDSLLMTAARLAEKQSDWDRAIELGRMSIAKNPEDGTRYDLVLRAFEKKGQLAEAIALLENMEPLFRLDNPRFLISYHELLLYVNRAEPAKDVRKAYRLAYPSQTIIADYMDARWMLTEGNAAAAANKLTTVVQHAPELPQAQYYLAVALLQNQQRQQARNALEVMLRSFPDDARGRALYDREFAAPVTARRTFGSAQEALVKPDTTAEELTAAAEQLFLEHPRQQDRKEMDTIKALLDTAIQRDPKYEHAYAAMVDFLVRNNALDEARAVLSKAEENLESLTDAPMMRSWIALASKDVPGAIEEFKKVGAPGKLTAADVRRWAGSFVVRAGLDAGLALLDAAKALLTPEESEQLRYEGASLCVRFGDIERALAALDAAGSAATPGGQPDASENAAKEMLIPLLLQSGKAEYLDKAKALVGALRAANPDNDRYKYLDVQVLVSQTPPAFEAAWEVLNGLLQTHPNDAEVLSAMADLALKQQNMVSALDYARRATAAAPQNAQIQVKLAQIQLQDKKAGEARTTLEYVLTIEPNSVRAMELLVTAYLATNRLEQADGVLARLEKVASTPESQAKLDFLRGRVQAARGQNVGNIEASLRDRYVRNPDDATILNELAVIVASQGKRDEAEQLLTGFAENHSSMEDAWVMLGAFYLSSEDLDSSQTKASAAFTRALIIRPDYGPALRGLTDLSLRSGNRTHALLLCDRYLALYPSTPDILYRKAFLLAEAPATLAAAFETVNQAITLDKRTEYLFLRGQINLNEKRFAEALKDFLDVAQAQSINSPALDMALAETYLGTGDSSAAKSYYEAAGRKLDNGVAGNRDQLQKLGQKLTEAGVVKP